MLLNLSYIIKNRLAGYYKYPFEQIFENYSFKIYFFRINIINIFILYIYIKAELLR